MSKEVMKLALEALVQLDGIDTETECVTIDVDDVITALRQALETDKQWVGLTDEEIWSNGSRLSLSERGIREFARAIEAKLKEKNHGRGEQ